MKNNSVNAAAAFSLLVSAILLHLQSVSSCSSLARYPASPVSLGLLACHHSDSDSVQSGGCTPPAPPLTRRLLI